jgi:cytidylate kinase
LGVDDMGNVITIDGPAGSGKSTVSRLLAEKLGFVYLDTGAMYRAVALAATRAGIALDDGGKLAALCGRLALRFERRGSQTHIFLGDEDVSQSIRSPEMDMGSSRVSAVREVREAMTVMQRHIAAGLKVIAEGRDMGTVVFPGSHHKFFLTASPEARAERRYRERVLRGEPVNKAVVATELSRRDEQDQTREIAPLRPAPDAVRIDTTALAVREVVQKILRHLGHRDENPNP